MALRQATLLTFSNLVDLCIEEGAAFLLVAGDVFDGADRSLRAQLVFRDGLVRLAEKGIRCCVSAGNHDPLIDWTDAVAWPDNTTLFQADAPVTVRMERDGESLAMITGISHARRNETSNLAAQLTPQESDLFQIALLHANCGGSRDHEPYAPCAKEELASAGFDYWALGHVHNHAILSTDPLIVYPGVPQGRNIREAGERGCCVVHVGSNGHAETEFRTLDVVRWNMAELDITGLKDVGTLREKLEERLEQTLSSAEGRAVVCRLTLTGRGPLAATLCNAAQLDEIAEYLREIFQENTPFLWLESLRNTTAPLLDLDAMRGRDDFLGLLLETATELRNGESSEALMREALGPLFTHKNAQRCLTEPSREELETLLDKAELLCGALFEEESGE